MVILGLEFSTDHLSIITMGYQESFSNENVVVYDIVDLFNSFDGILVAECRKRIVITILNFVSRKKLTGSKLEKYSFVSPLTGTIQQLGYVELLV